MSDAYIVDELMRELQKMTRLILALSFIPITKLFEKSSSDEVVRPSIRIGDSTHIVNGKEDIKKLAKIYNMSEHLLTFSCFFL